SSNEVVFKTLSPVLLEIQVVDDSEGRQKKKDIRILPPMKEGEVDDKFNEAFTSIHKGILKDIMGEEWVDKYFNEPLEFIPVSLKKRVIKHTISAYWQSNPDDPIMKFTCFDGCFKLKGNQEVLQMLYQIGIGVRTGQGFGMVEVV
ncbi:MAG: hypothetical protein N2202_09745, partial [Proteobacteria bacterium]|nr:hypothetical protein [Pseudomonadota bacterium]